MGEEYRGLPNYRHVNPRYRFLVGRSAITYKVFEEKLWGYINDQIQLISNTYPTASLNDSNMMFCRECGAKIPRSSRFCEKCGNKLV